MQARLLVDKAHMGTIMGRAGAAVSELRKATGASIKILPDQAGLLPGCERVHIFGEPSAVRAGLEAVSGKLRTAQARTPVSRAHVMLKSLTLLPKHSSAL